MLTVVERDLLLGLAASFDEVQRQQPGGPANGNVTPGDDYSNRGDLESFLSVMDGRSPKGVEESYI